MITRRKLLAAMLTLLPLTAFAGDQELFDNMTFLFEARWHCINICQIPMVRACRTTVYLMINGNYFTMSSNPKTGACVESVQKACMDKCLASTETQHYANTHMPTAQVVPHAAGQCSCDYHRETGNWWC